MPALFFADCCVSPPRYDAIDAAMFISLQERYTCHTPLAMLAHYAALICHDFDTRCFRLRHDAAECRRHASFIIAMMPLPITPLMIFRCGDICHNAIITLLPCRHYCHAAVSLCHAD